MNSNAIRGSLRVLVYFGIGLLLVKYQDKVLDPIDLLIDQLVRLTEQSMLSWLAVGVVGGSSLLYFLAADWLTRR